MNNLSQISIIFKVLRLQKVLVKNLVNPFMIYRLSKVNKSLFDRSYELEYATNNSRCQQFIAKEDDLPIVSQSIESVLARCRTDAYGSLFLRIDSAAYYHYLRYYES